MTQGMRMLRLIERDKRFSDIAGRPIQGHRRFRFLRCQRRSKNASKSFADNLGRPQCLQAVASSLMVVLPHGSTFLSDLRPARSAGLSVPGPRGRGEARA